MFDDGHDEDEEDEEDEEDAAALSLSVHKAIDRPAG